MITLDRKMETLSFFDTDTKNNTWGEVKDANELLEEIKEIEYKLGLKPRPMLQFKTEVRLIPQIALYNRSVT